MADGKINWDSEIPAEMRLPGSPRTFNDFVSYTNNLKSQHDQLVEENRRMQEDTGPVIETWDDVLNEYGDLMQDDYAAELEDWKAEMIEYFGSYEDADIVVAKAQELGYDPSFMTVEELERIENDYNNEFHAQHGVFPDEYTGENAVTGGGGAVEGDIEGDDYFNFNFNNMEWSYPRNNEGAELLANATTNINGEEVKLTSVCDQAKEAYQQIIKDVVDSGETSLNGKQTIGTLGTEFKAN